MHDVLRAFLEEEPGAARQVLATIREDQSGSVRVQRTLNFNIFDVDLDYTAGTLVIASILNPPAEVHLTIAEFTRIAADHDHGTDRGLAKP